MANNRSTDVHGDGFFDELALWRAKAPSPDGCDETFAV
jgi:hypothetical protein